MARREGTGFELTIAEEYGFRETAGSGSSFSDGDHRHPAGKFVVEAKDWTTEGFSFSRNLYIKLKNQAIKWGQGNWVRFYRNAHGEVVVSMNEKLFKALLTVADGVLTCPECGKESEIDW